jgi:hypothetical protein
MVPIPAVVIKDLFIPELANLQDKRGLFFYASSYRRGVFIFLALLISFERRESST